MLAILFERRNTAISAHGMEASIGTLKYRNSYFSAH